MSTRRRVVYGVAALAAVAGASALLAPKVLRRMDMQGLRPVTLAKGLEFPWALAFLPGGRMLVTERPGRMRIIGADGKLGEPLPGLPPVSVGGEGGLLDVALDPDFANNQSLYWSFAEAASTSTDAGSGTAVARARLINDRIVEPRVIFRQTDKSTDGTHFGSRLLFAPDGHLFVTLGDRGNRAAAQRLNSSIGKIVRIDRNGGTPAGNPFASTADALPQIWSLGHRNVQGAAFHPTTGELWASEHGPQGGDELNVIVAGRNYGWPVITYGTEYLDSAKIGEGTAKDGMEQPVTWWGPISNAPCGMTFLTSDRYPGWKGDLFVATLRGQALLRVKLDGHKVVEQQRLVTGLLDKIRDVRQGPDGWLYIVSSGTQGRVIRVER